MSMPDWIADLVDKGGSLQDCITLWRELQKSERDERNAEREMRRVEMEQDLKKRELALKEKELEQRKELGEVVSHDSGNTGYKNVKLPKFSEGQDPDIFLRSFEKLAALHKWNKTEWAIRLVPLLSGKALEAYSRLSDEDSAVYDKIKDAILKRYELTAEAYREKFRKGIQDSNESFREFKVKIEGYLKHWCDRESIDGDYNNLYDMFLREQLLQSCNLELRLWIKEHKPESAEQVVELAESYQMAHKSKGVHHNYGKQVGSASNQTWKPSFNKVQERGKFEKKSYPPGNASGKTCFLCNRQGHLKYNCPLRTQEEKKRNEKVLLCIDPPGKQVDIAGLDVNMVKLSGVSIPTECEGRNIPGLDTVEGRVNGKKVSVLRDTGSSTVFVHNKIVLGTPRTGIVKDICLADGTVRHCDEVWINIETPYISGTVQALVLDVPFADLVIGNYINTVSDKTGGEGKESTVEHEYDKSGVCQAMQTRSQGKKEKEKEIQSREERDALEKSDLSQNGVENEQLYSREELILAQKEDNTLEKVRSLVGVDQGRRASYFVMKVGVLYRIYVSPTGLELSQVVLPQKYRGMVLSLAHDIPLSGHLGMKKTRESILQNFFWPGIFEDVSTYCKSCPVCQLTSSKGRVAKVPLVSIPPMDTPFQRIAIDFVGPLPMTEDKNRFILVIVDCATRYPEAIALRNQDAETVVEALMGVFSRVGFPEEILSDQGSNFMSALMVEVCRLLKVKKLVSSVYHPQTNGMCERFNGVLKSMLKSYAKSEPHRWDRYLIYVLFAYREVPNDSTGFSPFELLYGRNVRGPLSILKEHWEEPEESQASVLSYLIETRDRLKTLSEMARKNEGKAKVSQKMYYDKKTKKREIEVGNKVLVLLPTNTCKLLAQWKGPYQVTDRISSVDYKVNVRGKEKVYHINMLKVWHERPQELKECVFACMDMPVNEDIVSEMDDRVAPQLEPTESVTDIKICDELSIDQVDKLLQVLNEYSHLFTDIPKRTSLVTHKVKTTTDVPVYKKPYPIPFALRDKVQVEIDNMLKMGIIEPVESPYASPIVLVKKPDNSLRFCCDYRELNKITEFDPTPMPRIDEVLNKVGKAKFVSKIDLTKGYWQISLDNDAKLKSAFVTPMGQYAFTVMPFGMVNSSASFVRLMKKILVDCKDFAESFIDDICIYSDSWEDHVGHIRSVLQALEKGNVAARPKKCSFGFPCLEFLGHMVGNGEIKPTQDKVNAIINCKPPETKKQVRSFVGLIGFYRKFVPEFSKYSAPITDLPKRDYPIR